MLKSIYNTLDEVPEAFREHYLLQDGKYVLKFDDAHPTVTHNATLLREKRAADTKAAGLETEVSTLKAQPTVPAGHVVVPAADAQFIEAIKPLGKNAAEIKSKVETGDKLARESHLRAVAKLVGFNEDAILLVPNLPEIEIRDIVGTDGKATKAAIAKFKDATGKDSEAPFTDHVKATSTLAPFQPMLQTQSGTTGGTGGQQQQQQQQRQTSFIGQEAGGGKTAGSVFDRIRAEQKAVQEHKTATDKPLEARLGMIPVNQQ